MNAGDPLPAPFDFCTGVELIFGGGERVGSHVHAAPTGNPPPCTLKLGIGVGLIVGFIRIEDGLLG